jgi:hypothetical protein
MVKKNPHCGNPECWHFRSAHRRAADGGCSCHGCECTRFQGSLESQAKLTTAQFRERLAPVGEGVMCWEAAFAALGVTLPHDKKGRSTTWIQSKLEENGIGYEWLKPSQLVPGSSEKADFTLAVVLPKIEKGSWLVFTSGHVIAVRDGKVTDSVGESRSVKRRVEFVFKLKNVSFPMASTCGCFDPVAFGHADCPLSGWSQGGM